MDRSPKDVTRKLIVHHVFRRLGLGHLCVSTPTTRKNTLSGVLDHMRAVLVIAALLLQGCGWGKGSAVTSSPVATKTPLVAQVDTPPENTVLEASSRISARPVTAFLLWTIGALEPAKETPVRDRRRSRAQQSPLYCRRGLPKSFESFFEKDW